MSKVDKNKDIKNWYISNFKEFESKLNGQSKSYLHELRKDAINKLEELNFPTLKDEEWKYTNVAPILNQQFKIPLNIEDSKLSKNDIEKYLFPDLDSYQLVFVNGIFNKNLSNIEDLPKGFIIDNLKNVSENNPDLLKKYLKRNPDYDNAFDALNAAYSSDGIVVVLPKNKILDKPLHVLYVSGHKNDVVLSVPRNLIVAEDNSQAKLILNYNGLELKPYLKNIHTDIFVGKNAVVDFYKIENEDDSNGYHIDNTSIYQKDNSTFSHFSFNFGGRIVRNDLKSKLDGENVECNYYGLYLASGEQHIDNHTFVDHSKPNSVSNELYKGILDDNSKGVFSGKILVRQDAQKTNAYQSNKTVLLSEKANIDTKPQLEIYADDVKCSHGATVGHLDDTAYFYIRSRGVPAELAKSMLITAFVNDVVEKVTLQPVKEKLNHMIFEQLNRIKI